MSVGHVARAIEEAGTPTVIVMVRSFAHWAVDMHLPRSVVVNHPMGRPMGPQGDALSQRAVLDEALSLLVDARKSGTIFEHSVAFRS